MIKIKLIKVNNFRFFAASKLVVKNAILMKIRNLLYWRQFFQVSRKIENGDGFFSVKGIPAELSEFICKTSIIYYYTVCLYAENIKQLIDIFYRELFHTKGRKKRLTRVIFYNMFQQCFTQLYRMLLYFVNSVAYKLFSYWYQASYK